ncbi:MAG: hypothetical protein ACAI35_20310 [Candidatus Methylacidiphilales bacterium]|nr:hypothetical protein [Candidatus Methylacidiphilales bacterium]
MTQFRAQSIKSAYFPAALHRFVRYLVLSCCTGVLLGFTSLPNVRAGEYPYAFYECTGPNRFVVMTDGKECELKAFATESNAIARDSLQALPASILYPNSKGKIILVGKYDATTRLFTLKHWTLPVPFIEWQKMDRIGGAEKVTRYSLTRKDFQISKNPANGSFDPDSKMFNPRHFIRKIEPGDVNDD